MTLALERRLEIEIILDDAVVDNDEAARAVAVRMRVLFGWTAMCGPPRMPQAVVACDGVGRQHFLEPREFARAAPHIQSAVGDQRNAGRVVAAVLQAPQA